MVSDMLFLARVDRGMLKLNLEQVDLVEEVRSVAEFFEAAAAEHDKRIEVTGVGSAPCDRSMARRAITNLVSNAVRYSARGATIRINVTADSPQFLLVQVENSSTAMDDAELRRMFGRFTRGPNAHKSTAEGAGLGLSIVESLMRLHGGRIEAESAPQVVRFRLMFPAASTAKV
ncbi:MAG TPA: ATP-binding protein, partial [Burkholderiaceae bacterium]|nr:ATP-binding protein [Burkholderiaceae bacterium]